MNTRLLLGAMLLATTPIFAAEVDGTWAGSIEAPTGGPGADAASGPAMEVKFTFKSEGEKLTGAAIGPDGTELPISDGKITGNTATFTLSIDMGQGPMSIGYKGEIEKDKMTMSMTMMDMPIPIALVLSKTAAKPADKPAATSAPKP